MTHQKTIDIHAHVGWAGASHVLLGSDYPFDMGTLECVREVRASRQCGK